MSLLPLLSTLLALPAPAQEEPAPLRIELPAGPAASAWARLDPSAPPLSLGPADLPPPADDPAWNTGEPWLAWARAVRAEAEAEAPDPKRRARLAALAWQQGRAEDAWDHLAACAAEPRWMAAVMPLFLPGAGVEELLEGGPDAARGLPDGAVLRPAVPPPFAPGPERVPGRLEKRAMKIEGMRVGAAMVSMQVSIEYDGVQVDLAHAGGGRARLAVVLPEPEGFEIGVEYADWDRQETVGQPLEVELAPGSETFSLYGRVRPRPRPWPEGLPGELPVALREHGLRLEVRAGDPLRPRIEGVAAGLRELLGLPVELAEVSGAPEPFAGIAVGLDAGPLAEEKLAAVLSLAERFALR